MRILGLDLGTKTLGLAVSDLTETISSGLTTLRINENEEENVIPELKKIVEEYNVSLFVIGLPKNMNNTLGDAVLRTRNFEEILKVRDLYNEQDNVSLPGTTLVNLLNRTDDIYYTVPKKLENRLDTISYNFYGNVDLWWVIALASNIKNPLEVPKDTVVRIPPLQTLFFVRGTSMGGR